MNTPKLAVALALVLWAIACGSPAPAATIDYALTIPLVDSMDPTVTSLLTGTLSYDDSGTSTFSIVDSPDGARGIYSGFAWLMAQDDTTTGVLFDGFLGDVSELYFNLLAGSGPNAIVSGTVNYCPAGCSMFTGVGAVMVPGTFTHAVPGNGATPGTVVSPVPLPPAASLFGGALLALAGLGLGRSARLRPQPAARS